VVFEGKTIAAIYPDDSRILENKISFIEIKNTSKRKQYLQMWRSNPRISPGLFRKIGLLAFLFLIDN